MEPKPRDMEQITFRTEEGARLWADLQPYIDEHRDFDIYWDDHGYAARAYQFRWVNDHWAISMYMSSGNENTGTRTVDEIRDLVRDICTTNRYTDEQIIDPSLD